MKKLICDICGREITAADIHMTMILDIDEKKTDTLDMHSICYLYLKEAARRIKEENEKNLPEE